MALGGGSAQIALVNDAVCVAQEFGGCGGKREVTEAVIQKMVKRGFVSHADLELLATGETKAENTITWGRNAFKNRGFIGRGARRGIWETHRRRNGSGQSRRVAQTRKTVSVAATVSDPIHASALPPSGDKVVCEA